MRNATFLNMGFWNNIDAGNPKREEGVQKVIDAVEEFGVVKVSFEYTGRTAHQIASVAMAEKLPKEYKKEIGYNYKFIVSKGGA